MVVTFEIYTGALKIIFVLVHYLYYIHRDSENYLHIGYFTIIYTLVHTKDNFLSISPQILKISLPFDVHGKTNINTY
jgi:hypothetical protein